MMKLKMSPDIIYTVTKLYAGNKSTEMLECLIEFGQMENGKNWNLQLQHRKTNQLVLNIINV